MKPSSISVVFQKISTPLFFILLFGYQLIFALQGIDFLDEGFSATFYQQFFNDPRSVQYNFLFWLSGLVGGSFNYLLPDSGFLGLRILGVICVISAGLITYNFLKNYINRTYLKIGIALVTFAVAQNPKIFHYNLLSIVLYTSTAALLFNGLIKNKRRLLFLSGCLVALDTFTRLPSILNLGLVVVIAFYGFLYNKSIWQIIKQSFVFILGFIVSAVAVLIVMKLMGHLDIYIDSLKGLFQMGKTDTDVDYSLVKLIKQFFISYKDALLFTIAVLILIILAAVLPKFLKERIRLKTWMIILAKYFCILLACLIMLKGIEILIRFYVGLIFITLALALFTKTNKEIKVLMLMGTFISIAYPLASSAGIFTTGVNTFWLAIPVSISIILSIQSFDLNFTFNKDDQPALSNNATITAPQFTTIKKWVITISVLACVYHQWFYPLHDESSRFKMVYTINNKYVKGIFTTKERAAATNELLQQSSTYVKEGDYVLAFHSFPVYHYMTKTRPYTGNAMPWYYESSVFKIRLEEALKRTNILPVVIMQKIKTTAVDRDDWPDDWPQDPIFRKPETNKRVIRETEYMNEFLQKYSYHIAWENEYFKLLIPENKILN